MSLAYNSERGEVPLAVGGVELVIAAEMGRLAALSTRLGSQSFMDMYSKLASAEINAVLAGVELLAVKGDVGKALKEITLSDLHKCVEAFIKAFSHHADQVKNAEPAKETTETDDSLGGSTKASQP
jgi:hypothetical protein